MCMAWLSDAPANRDLVRTPGAAGRALPTRPPSEAIRTPAIIAQRGIALESCPALSLLPWRSRTACCAGLYGHAVPQTVANFMEAIRGGVYTSTTFNRILPGAYIQVSEVIGSSAMHCACAGAYTSMEDVLTRRPVVLPGRPSGLEAVWAG